MKKISSIKDFNSMTAFVNFKAHTVLTNVKQIKAANNKSGVPTIKTNPITSSGASKLKSGGRKKYNP